MAERCPLCYGKLKNGECASCGYRIPDENEISALYNYDPDDYPQPEEDHIREIIPDVQPEEIYPDRPEPVNIKVRNSQGKTIRPNNSKKQNDPYSKTPRENPYYRQSNRNYPQSGQYGQNSNNPSPYYQQGNNQGGYFGNGQQNNDPADFKSLINDFFVNYWWFVFLCLFMPFIGIFTFVFMKKAGKIDQKYNVIFFILIILSFFRYVIL